MLVGKHYGKNSHGTLKCKEKCNIKINLGQIVYNNVKWKGKNIKYDYYS